MNKKNNQSCNIEKIFFSLEEERIDNKKSKKEKENSSELSNGKYLANT